MCLGANEDILEQSSRRRDACFGQLGLMRNVIVGRIRRTGMEERNVIIFITTTAAAVIYYRSFHHYYYFIIIALLIVLALLLH